MLLSRLAIAEGFAFYSTHNDNGVWAVDRKSKRVEGVVTLPANRRHFDEWALLARRSGLDVIVAAPG